ncbi:MAG: hypothetical protein ACYC0Y_25575 [Pirellulales bacterium]
MTRAPFATWTDEEIKLALDFLEGQEGKDYGPQSLEILDLLKQEAGLAPPPRPQWAIPPDWRNHERN